MTFYTDLFPAFWHWLCWPLLIFCLSTAIWQFPLRKVLAVPLRQHLVLGSAVAMALIWMLAAQLGDHPFGIHLFAVTVVVMLIGVSPTLIASGLALVLYTLVNRDVQWIAFAVNYSLGILPPILVSAACLKIVSRLPQKNLFAYMLGVGFAGAIVARLITTFLLYGLMLLSGEAVLLKIADTYLPWMLLITFPEGFINGTIASGVTVYLPHWVRSFDEERYLG
ncbi:energy-coupling factor ABC transporter permease [Porticoccus sp. W117]|uniref:energy-coupling factor ABC transporter permease n=1 Tax=Porticoccus sp. W117 TaxID=3054777 RepID=UPI00259761D0|nr:energy-coupling factor ABC transporter permease [Porticoccus sp. W117]MDM3870769.1 energy-coupling factor ABC transporter permease [Porticoccus sp. W117]